MVAVLSGRRILAFALAAGLLLLFAADGRGGAEPSYAGTPSVDFSFGSSLAEGATGTCDSSGTPTNICLVPLGGVFTVSIYLHSFVPPTGYDAHQFLLNYSGVSADETTAGVDLSYWPGCSFPGRMFSPGQVLAGCSLGLSAPSSTYVGKLATVRFTCTSSGTITMQHGDDKTLVASDDFYHEPEGSSESLTIDCVAPGLDFSIGSSLAEGAAGTCDSSGTPTNTCQVPLGGTFRLSFYLNSLPTLPGGEDYNAYYSVTQYTGVAPTGGVDEDAWPDCYFTGYNPSGGQLIMGCYVGIGQPESTYTGRMFSQGFTCAADGTLTLVHGQDDTYLEAGSGFSGYIDEGEGTTETLNIDCVEPQAYPGDTDGDGCPDMREQGTNVMTGGQRNFLNPWDYFDANNDGVQRVPDITLVNANYGMDEGVSPYYTQEVDRTLLGPNDWNLGPPDGKVRVPDIVNQVRQYGHDCS